MCGAEGERRDPAQPMTAGALVAEDRRHVACEARGRRGARLGAAPPSSATPMSGSADRRHEGTENGETQARPR